jgi:ribosomal-protein-alanine N-acetyltransferase
MQREAESTSHWHIRELRKQDLGPVLSIEQVSFPSPWPRTAFLQEIRNSFSKCWVMESGTPADRLLSGYVSVWIVGDEMHIMNLATHPGYRRRGIARRLLLFVEEQAGDIGVRHLVLEVRPSNKAARALYSSLGFRAVGRRPGYYRDTGEDAVLMVKDLRS